MSQIEYAIITNNLTKKFNDFIAIDNLNIKVKRGEICGLVGPNGAGKTTLIEMLICALKPTSGSAMILGKDIQKDPIRAREKIGYLPENSGFYKDMSGFRFLQYMAELGGIEKSDAKEKANTFLNRVGLSERGNSKIENYSAGMKQRLAIAQAFVTEPEVVFLDEPTSDLDPLAREKILEMISDYARKGNTILITTHVLNIIEKISDFVAIIEKGKIKTEVVLKEISGSLEELYKNTIKGDWN
ncbi:MAG: ABC transporter ATP-binding protein [Promethearchaeota archaeon]